MVGVNLGRRNRNQSDVSAFHRFATEHHNLRSFFLELGFKQKELRFIKSPIYIRGDERHENAAKIIACALDSPELNRRVMLEPYRQRLAATKNKVLLEALLEYDCLTWGPKSEEVSIAISMVFDGANGYELGAKYARATSRYLTYLDEITDIVVDRLIENGNFSSQALPWIHSFLDAFEAGLSAETSNVVVNALLRKVADKVDDPTVAAVFAGTLCSRQFGMTGDVHIDKENLKEISNAYCANFVTCTESGVALKIDKKSHKPLLDLLQLSGMERDRMPEVGISIAPPKLVS